MRTVAAILLSTAFVACRGNSTNPEIEIAADYTLSQAADSVPLPSGELIRVDGVLLGLTDVEDHRCAVGTQCASAGDAVATILVHPSCYPSGCMAPSMVLHLHTLSEPRAGSHMGYRVELLRLDPTGPQPAGSRAKEAYVAWVRVSELR